MEGLKRRELDPILVEKKANLIVVSRGNVNSKYAILTNTIYTIEVITRVGRTEIKIKHDIEEIRLESQNPRKWDGKWGGNIVAIEYPNRDVWSDHPVLNELKLISSVSSTVEGSEGSADSNEKSSTEQQKETRKGNYQNGYLVFPDQE